MNVYIPYTRLPSAYQEVEYIQSSGTQYIKIGTQFKTSYKTVIDFQMTVTGGDYVPIGVRTADGGNKRYGIDAWNSYFKVIAGGGDWNNTIAEDTNRHTITLDKSTAIVDGTSYSVQYADYTFNEGIGVFYYHKIGETPYVDAISSNKLYKLDIYDENGTHIYDLVPCYRKSDNVIGLYDLVNNQFYTNSGTGTFSKGNDVTMAELKNAYIGEYKSDLYYDFTQSDGGWVANSGVSRGSNGFYINMSGTYIERLVAAPNEIYDRGIPKKITIIYNKSGSDTGTGIKSAPSGTTYYIFLPYDQAESGYINYLGTNNNGTISRYSLGANPTGVVTWEMNIDSSTSNWTVTHKVTGCTTVSETSGALKMIFNNKIFNIRLVHWRTTGMYIRSILFEY